MGRCDPGTVKKRVGLLLLAAALTLTLSACGRAKAGELVEESVNDCPGLCMTCSEDSVTAVSAVLELTNETEQTVGYGSDFAVQVSKEDGWHRLSFIRDNISFTAEEYLLEPGESTELTVNWQMLYGTLPAGDYRLVKHINYYHDDPNEQGPDGFDGYDLAAEFTLK